MALSPFTTPFAACPAGEIVGANLNTQRSVPRKDDYEAWVMHGVELGVEPTAPLATAIAAMSTSSPATLFAPATITTVAAAAPAPPSTRGGALPLVLRV